MKPLFTRAGTLLFVLFLVGTACSKSSSTTPTSQPPTPSLSSSPSGEPSTLTIDGKTANNKGTVDVTGMTTFTLNLDNDGSLFYFEPTVLQGSPGETISITLSNVGDTKHNFTIEGQNINADVDTPGTTAQATVTFPQSGSVEFHCEYHETLGMVGELVVSS